MEGFTNAYAKASELTRLQTDPLGQGHHKTYLRRSMRAALYGGSALTNPRFQCTTQGAEITMRISPPPQKKTAQGFDVIKLLVPKDVSMTGSIEQRVHRTGSLAGRNRRPMT